MRRWFYNGARKLGALVNAGSLISLIARFWIASRVVYSRQGRISALHRIRSWLDVKKLLLRNKKPNYRINEQFELSWGFMQHLKTFSLLFSLDLVRFFYVIYSQLKWYGVYNNKILSHNYYTLILKVGNKIYKYIIA